MWAPRQAVEIFHMLFLHAFGTRVDKSLYALKGGGNLRFFHKSIRYSEDIDLDVRPGEIPNPPHVSHGKHCAAQETPPIMRAAFPHVVEP